ncbi:integrator complex subunit 12-like [Teleopsis dalmanni]|uniref:integrator complex subunit 12-like n=1 Tax=Teleopsis dalmanni TaxID=139649 RepID=UPI0018CD170A|nr:integrator complex subunit 12-like [Teleopsis dalmanni]XP_037947844.1 integrator complex subunit 12-like [Teleopsis dalmanni]
MSVTEDVEQIYKRGVKLLYSSHPNSATELREMIDELIRQQYGTEKMICNTLTKKQLDDEINFPGRAVTPPPQLQLPTEPTEETEVINLINSPTKTISDSPDTIIDSEDGGGLVGSALLTSTEDDGNLKEFGDLNCCVCGEMMFTATNRLCECSMCGALYHQECHKPPISDEEASEESIWQCNNCSKPTTSKAAGFVVIPEDPIPLVAKIKSTSSRSSSSSNSSSPFYKQEQTSSSTSSKHHHKSSSSTNGSKSVITPTLNVISADEKRSSSSKKSSHSSSSKSKSKHHESSKRKSSK